MKSFFNDEVECYTNPSNLRFYILGIAVFAGAVALGWFMSVETWVSLFMDVMTDAV